jgi:ubiquinone/menaquinone biosynthesis C-methylase UbiE
LGVEVEEGRTKMGSVSLKIGDGTARFSRATLCSSAVNILMLLSVLTTNLFALYAFTSAPKDHQNHLLHNTHKNISLISEQVALILGQIDVSQKKLAKMEKEILGYESLDLSRPNLAKELELFLQHHQLPLGKDSRTGITEMVASVGHSCEKSVDLLSQYMTYKVSGPCPDDWSAAQKLILRGCEPLPRRRCFAKSAPKVGLFPFPISLWKPVSDKIFTWSGLGCKSLECLNKKKMSRDCVGCFDLVNGYENQRFVKGRSTHDFLIDDVLALGNGGIRIGLDIGGGSGTFAARMAERNVTVITNTLNVDAPFSEFIAARGLFPLFLSLDHRFPFYDNVFDLVHAASGFDIGGKPEKLEFLMFDIDRILRAGGLFWLDNFYCVNDEKKRELTRLIERFGYKKLKWVVGEKVDAAGSKSENYLSAVLQKPVRV